MVVMSGDVGRWCALFGTLVGVSVLSVMWSELESVSEISSPRWSSVYECQSVECAFTSPVIIELGMLVMYCMQFVMSVSVVSMVSCCGVAVFLGAILLLHHMVHIFRISKYYYYRFIVISLTFRLHFFLSWTSSLSISSSAMSASTLSNHVLVGRSADLLPYSPSPRHFSSLHVHTISAYHF